MSFDDLVEQLGRQGWFDLASLVQLTGEKRGSLHTQLHRWCRAGKLVPLRRGYYAFPANRTGQTVHAAELANILYTPSYLSTHWALGFYGIIPERVVRYTCVTTRPPREFENDFGTFSYRHIKQEAFFGYRAAVIDGRRVVLADPEKALLDLWHLQRGPWSPDRMSGMRFQNLDLIDAETLRRHAVRYGSPRLRVATEDFLRLAEADAEGAVEL